jgi:hypothetical protein
MLRPIMRILVIATIGLLSALASESVAAQSTAKETCGGDSPIPFARIGLRRLCQLAQRPDVQAATGAKDGLQLMALIPPDILLRLPDSTLSSSMTTFGETLAAVPVEACGSFAAGPGAPDWKSQFMQLALVLDSTMSVRWADALEGWVGVLTRKDPPRPIATSAEASAALGKVLADLPAKEKATLKAILGGAKPAAPEGCAFAKGLYRRLGSKSLENAGPVLRAVIAGKAPLPGPA